MGKSKVALVFGVCSLLVLAVNAANGQAAEEPEFRGEAFVTGGLWGFNRVLYFRVQHRREAQHRKIPVSALPFEGPEEYSSFLTLDCDPNVTLGIGIRRWDGDGPDAKPVLNEITVGVVRYAAIYDFFDYRKKKPLSEWAIRTTGERYEKMYGLKLPRKRIAETVKITESEYDRVKEAERKSGRGSFPRPY